MNEIVFLFTGVVLGAIASIIFRRLNLARWQSVASREASGIKQTAEDKSRQIMEAAQKTALEIEHRIRQRHQKEILQKEQRLQKASENMTQLRAQQNEALVDDEKSINREWQSATDRYQNVVDFEDQHRQRKTRYLSKRNEFIQILAQSCRLDLDTLKAENAQKIERTALMEAKKRAMSYEAEIRDNVEEIAKRHLSTALARFPRPYCSERGIGVVQFTSGEAKQRLCGVDNVNLKAIQAACGVDIIIQEENNTVAVAGFDPVRRELATRVLEKLLKERQIHPQTIERVVADTKDALFRKIEQDGNRVTKELGQTDLHPEIKRMLGSLRYRYSFAQNQHFHVAEVGWLCGLLASEVGVNAHFAKRSGLLHDVGKAMDHSIEGGHAVIGADFIQKYGEQDNIVHAVRAHHYEEQPNSDLAFLVIGADAISGARPGARRSTVSSYTQKMAALETIAEGFDGVLRTLIFNAGREVRVLVDGARINDEQSLKLCREIADKIEEECSYPGQIKVVVVRETHAEAMAK